MINLNQIKTKYFYLKRFGALKLLITGASSKYDKNVTEHDVRQIFIHELYHSNSSMAIENDLALLKVFLENFYFLYIALFNLKYIFFSFSLRIL